MSDKELEVGRWYAFNYGFEVVIGRCISPLPGGAMMSFRWGTLFRVAHYVEDRRILGKVSDPRFITKVLRLLITRQQTPRTQND